MAALQHAHNKTDEALANSSGNPVLEAVLAANRATEARLIITEENAHILKAEEPREESQNTDERMPLHDTYLIRERELLQTTPLAEEAVFPKAEEVAIEPDTLEGFGQAAKSDVDELNDVETVETVMFEDDYNLFEDDEIISIWNSLEHNDDQEILPYAMEASLPDVNLPIEFNSGEPSPVIAIPELPAPIVEIEAAMTILVEALENVEADEPGEIDAILEKIITLPAKFEATTTEEVAELEEKLEELFIELFEAVDISSTPELIKSFVKLTRAHYLEELLNITKVTEEETQDMPDEIGTREFLQKLQHGLSALRQAAINFYEIGKSILRLYASSFEPETMSF